MTAGSNDDNPPVVGQFDRFWWWLHGNTMLLALVLMLFLCVGGTFLYKPLFQRDEPLPDFEADLTSASLQIVQSTQNSDTYYLAWAEDGKVSDVYSLTVTAISSQPINLTNTPNYAEWWPVPSPVDDRLAFFVVSLSGERSLRVMDSNRAIVDATYNVAGSGLGDQYQIDLGTPPQWSEDGQWIAFLGRSLDEDHPAVEVFVTDVGRSKVYRLTQGGNVTIALRWSDPTHLVYIERRGDQSAALYQIPVSGSPVTPVLLGVLEPRP